jgi:hypothetical protein
MICSSFLLKRTSDARVALLFIRKSSTTRLRLAHPASARPSFLFPSASRRSESNRIRPPADRRQSASSTRLDVCAAGHARVRRPQQQQKQSREGRGDQRQARGRPVRLDATRLECSAVQSSPRMHCSRSQMHANTHSLIVWAATRVELTAAEAASSFASAHPAGRSFRLVPNRIDSTSHSAATVCKHSLTC